jgi:F1F0 ATPase subunit 2
MNDTLAMVLACVAGLFLGAVFFGGLWWTVRKGVSSAQPAALFLGSLLLRMSIVLAGLYLVGHEHAERLMLCLLGILVARFVVMRLTRPSVDRHHPRAGEVPHAS